MEVPGEWKFQGESKFLEKWNLLGKKGFSWG
jgi:hypothetical protein